ncbi:hypothetical protein DFR30_1153 [Thiogranum longum]|uniref:Uncharacterized protein n=1 Tax=Thiogranum longum TaxID=1537524 RepID=A0A4R1HEW7_9GAMM|nr:hypothetical protein [Thiogranum longum]TCK17899.1 hypothetical protein DFR30_1153 [Thiogranum longum]
MDVTRLPSASYTRPVTSPASAGAHAGFTSVVEPVGVANESNRVDNERPARVVQGELLERHRSSYQSTRAFVNEHNLDHSRPADQSGISSLKSRSALFQYANNIRPESLSDLTQGRSVNYFV